MYRSNMDQVVSYHVNGSVFRNPLLHLSDRVSKFSDDRTRAWNGVALASIEELGRIGITEAV
jgi:hypothetical protein